MLNQPADDTEEMISDADPGLWLRQVIPRLIYVCLGIWQITKKI